MKRCLCAVTVPNYAASLAILYTDSLPNFAIRPIHLDLESPFRWMFLSAVVVISRTLTIADLNMHVDKPQLKGKRIEICQIILFSGGIFANFNLLITVSVN